MKNLLIILSLTLVFACHTKEDQDKSGVNDPINIIYNDVDSSTLSMNGRKAAPVEAPAPKAEECIDSSKIQPDAMCTQEFKPVCGCDGKEYPNQCEAEKAGLTKWVDGPCEKKSEKAAAPKKAAPKTSSKESKKDSKKKKKK